VVVENQGCQVLPDPDRLEHAVTERGMLLVDGLRGRGRVDPKHADVVEQRGEMEMLERPLVEGELPPHGAREVGHAACMPPLDVHGGVECGHEDLRRVDEEVPLRVAQVGVVP
jgi:hypothetical protein